MPDLADVLEARKRIEDHVVRTPCTRSMVFRDLLSCRLHFKFENLQHTGSFKVRGAANKLAQLSEEERARGVITASAGNHAQAVAYHATRLGIPSTVVMPEYTPLIKVSNTRRHGADVVLHGTRFSQAVERVYEMADDEGQVVIHAFDDHEIIAGQGTLGLELLDQVPDATTVLVPIGGGGVISGTAIAVKSRNPDARIIGVEAEAAPSAYESRKAGERVPVESADTIADGIAVKQVGRLTFPIIEELVDEIVLVDEESIASAILLMLEREKTVVEGAGASVVAALLSGKVSVDRDDVVVPVLCGGNIDVTLLSRIIDRGLVNDGRLVRLMIKMPDRPGSLARLTDLAADLGANVLEIAHRRAFADIALGDVEIVMHLETRGRDHVGEIVAALEAQGLEVAEDV